MSRLPDPIRRFAAALFAGLLGLILTGVIASAQAGAAGANSTTAAKIGVASARYLNSDPGKLNAIGASWAYDWSATQPPSDSSLQWVPMTWGSGSLTPAVLTALRRAKRDGEASYLLGFNEPDSGSQSNLTPAQAAALWPQLESTGLILGSPAPAVPTDGWLSSFMSLVAQRHLRVNFIALHYYQDFTNPKSVSELRAQLIQIHREYQRPIWVTEIGALNIRSWGEAMLHPASSASAVSYMRQLFAMLNALPFVQRYAWFTDDCWSDVACRDSSLFNANGQITPAGREFRDAAA